LIARIERRVVNGHVQSEGLRMMDDRRQARDELVGERAAKLRRVHGRHHGRIEHVHVEVQIRVPPSVKMQT
jgi:hypothetical protein